MSAVNARHDGQVNSLALMKLKNPVQHAAQSMSCQNNFPLENETRSRITVSLCWLLKEGGDGEVMKDSDGVFPAKHH